ncbi:MAG TPA: SDR family NAD(P)-dependent oxidoreductase [Steroidobacteraceae bacterium]|nr:SDR family NAD(P)-dependent oxidoreductase [Steroidobacteraceae bacterium]
MSDYQPRVALVTGASRGAGKGIALALGAAGMTVYVTGRSVTRSLGRLKDVPLPGTILETAAQITSLGGTGIALSCDHRDDAAVEAAVARVAQESGMLDILVNNAASIHDALIDPGGFWEKPLELADILDVGLRSAYVASYFAAPLMVRARRGLIAFVSSFGSSCYMHGPAYGAQKAGVDKFAADMAVDLAPYGVATASLWLGPQLTERTAAAGRSRPEQYAAFLQQAETPQFNGRIIHALARDPELMSLSGQTLISAEVAHRYGITEEGGREPPSYRQMLGEPRQPHPAKVM